VTVAVETVKVATSIRSATKDERKLFMGMWMQYVRVEWNRGGEIVPDAKTRLMFEGFFDAYLSGELLGVALVKDAPHRHLPDFAGVLLWGQAAAEMPFTSRYDPFVLGWGTYVHPLCRGQGLASALRANARMHLREMGISHVLGAVLNANPTGIRSGAKDGFSLYAAQGVLEI